MAIEERMDLDEKLLPSVNPSCPRPVFDCSAAAGVRWRTRLGFLNNGLIKAMTVELDISESDAAVDAALGFAWQCLDRINVLINDAGFTAQEVAMGYAATDT